jgi:hypothetical protein
MLELWVKVKSKDDSCECIEYTETTVSNINKWRYDVPIKYYDYKCFISVF